MLISVHLPKTAGTSLKEELRHQFNEKLVLDYEIPVWRSAAAVAMRALLGCAVTAFRPLRGVECIHGHFYPLKYAPSGLRDGATFVTWMREPVERVASQYFHTMRNPTDPNQSAFHRKVIREKWPLERYCLSPQRRNMYRRFLWGVPLRRFAFIGIAEHYESELKTFAARYLPKPIQNYRVNVNPHRDGRPYITDPNLRRQIADYHRADVELYERALQMRAARLGTDPR